MLILYTSFWNARPFRRMRECVRKVPARLPVKSAGPVLMEVYRGSASFSRTISNPGRLKRPGNCLSPLCSGVPPIVEKFKLWTSEPDGLASEWAG